MAVTEMLRLIIDADTSGAVRGVTQLGAVSKRELTRSEQLAQKWGNALTTAGAGMIALGAVGVAGLVKAAQASEEAHRSVLMLENTLANMPQLAGETSGQFIDLADSIQGVTAADADAIVEAEALLGTFQLTAEEIKGITPLVVDYARKFGLDIPAAAVQVGKALDGSIGALKRNGVSIDEAAFATDRYAAVQQALSEQVGGFAEAEGATFAGSLERLKNEMGDLAEGVGVGAVDAFSSLFGAVEGVTDKFQELSPEAQSTIGKLATFGSVGLVAAGGLSILIGQAIKMHQNFQVAATAVSGLTTRLGGLRTIVGFGALTAGAFALGQELAKLDDAASRARFDKLLNMDELVVALDSGSEASRRYVERAVALIDHMGTLDQATKAIADTNMVAAEQFVDAAEAAGVEGEQLARLREILDATRSADELNTAAQGEYSASLQETAGSADDAVSALQEYSDTLTAMVDPLFGMVDALQDNRDAQAEVAAAQVAVNEAQAAGDPDALAEANRRLSEAHRAAAGTALDMTGAVAVLEDGIAAGTVSVSDARGQLDRWVAQGLISRDTANAMAFSFGAAAAQADALAGNYDVTVRGHDNASAMVDRINNKLASLRDRSVTVRTNFVTTGPGGSGGIPLFHKGGIVPGPRGQEVAAILQAGERVISLADMAGSRSLGPAGDGGAGGTLVVNVDLRGAIVPDARSPAFDRLIAESVHRGIRQGGVQLKAGDVRVRGQ